MTTKRATPQHTFAVDDDLWSRLASAAKTAGFNRSALLRQFIRWYLREPGAKLPQRPSA